MIELFKTRIIRLMTPNLRSTKPILGQAVKFMK